MRIVIEVTTAEKSFHVHDWRCTGAETTLNRIELQLDLARQVWPEEFKGVTLRIDKRPDHAPKSV